MRNSLLLMVLSALMLLIVGCADQKAPEKSAPPSLTAPVTAQMTSLVVHLPDDQPSKVWEVQTGGEMTVKELMDALKEAQFAFTDTLYPGMGHLVTGVAGIRNAGGEGAYWQFCIDNVASDRGVDEKTVRPGQQVDWHYSKYGELPCKKIGE
jgi:hypothetical protein